MRLREIEKLVADLQEKVVSIRLQNGRSGVGQPIKKHGKAGGQGLILIQIFRHISDAAYRKDLRWTLPVKDENLK